MKPFVCIPEGVALARALSDSSATHSLARCICTRPYLLKSDMSQNQANVYARLRATRACVTGCDASHIPEPETDVWAVLLSVATLWLDNGPGRGR